MDHLTFRFTKQEDAPLLHEWLSDPTATRWFPMGDPKEIEDSVRVWIASSIGGTGITVLWDGEPCGMSNLYVQPYKKQAHTCLFAIIVKGEFRGKGVGKALLSYMMHYAKEQFHIEILHLEVYDGNPARHLYERLGFREYGRQTYFIKENGQYYAKVYMQKEL